MLTRCTLSRKQHVKGLNRTSTDNKMTILRLLTRGISRSKTLQLAARLALILHIPARHALLSKMAGSETSYSDNYDYEDDYDVRPLISHSV
jgi:hypothetical protein